MRRIDAGGSAVIAWAVLALILFSACSAVPGLGKVSDPPADQADSTTAVGDSPADRSADDPDVAAPTAAETGRGPVSTAGPPRPAAAEDGKFGGAFIREIEKWGDMVLALVDGEEVRASDIYQTFFLENPVRTRNALQNEILYILAGKEASRLGVTVASAEAEEVLEKTIEDHRQRCAAFLTDGIDLEKFVETQYGMSFDEYRLTLQRTAVFNLLLDRLVRLDEMSRRRLQVGVIVVKEQLLAEEIRRKLLNGASFDVLAEKHSLDRSSAGGGILAPIPVDANHPLYPLVESVIGMETGAVSPVEPTPYMTEKVYRIVKLVADLEPRRGAYGDLAGEVEESLRNDPIDLAAIQYWQLNLRSRYNIELKAR